MAGIKLQKRDFDFFVSYGHRDAARVAPLVDLLKRVCGLHVWFDGAAGNAAQRSSELLAGGIGNARGALFCLTESWKDSSWCRNEFEVSLAEQRMHDGFVIVCVRLDDAEPPSWLTVAEILDLRTPDAVGVARLLCSLALDVPRRFDNREDIYLAAPWSRPSSPVRTAFEVLARTGWRLVGDAPDLKHLGEQRIEAIQRTTRGVVALLPHDPAQPDVATSPYILQEARWAIEQRRPLLLLPSRAPSRPTTWSARPSAAGPSRSLPRATAPRWRPCSRTSTRPCSTGPTRTPVPTSSGRPRSVVTRWRPTPSPR